MAIYSNLICLLCVSVVIYEVHGKSIPKRKRCGVNYENFTWHKSRHTRSLHAVVDGHWNQKTITYVVLNAPQQHPAWVRYPQLSRERVGQLAQQAFDEWAPHCGLRFQQRFDLWSAGSLPDIVISFKRCWHGDRVPFDGPGKQLAHASYPSGFVGFVHFDDDEIWVEAKTNREEEAKHINSFYPVLLHEIGHTLGVTHSKDKNSIMYADENSHVQHLAASDILSIRDLYGISENNSIAEELPTSASSVNVPFTTPSEEVPTATASEEEPTATPSEEVTTTTPNGAVPTATASEELPTTTLSGEVTTTTPSEAVPTTTLSGEVTTTTPNGAVPTATASEELPTTTLSGEVTTTTPSEAVPPANPSELSNSTTSFK